MKTADEHIWAVGEIASYNGGMCYQLSAPGKSWDGGWVFYCHGWSPLRVGALVSVELPKRMHTFG